LLNVCCHRIDINQYLTAFFGVFDIDPIFTLE